MKNYFFSKINLERICSRIKKNSPKNSFAEKVGSCYFCSIPPPPHAPKKYKKD